jgi:hypothetical protein
VVREIRHRSRSEAPGRGVDRQVAAALAVWLCLALTIAIQVGGLADPLSAEQTAEEIQQAIKAAGADWTAGVTWVSRLSTEEKRALCGDLGEEVLDALKTSLPLPRGALPGHFDWRDNGGDWTTPIRNQAGCGSCWGFAATAVLESLLNIDAGNPSLDIDISEQYVLSCCGNCGDCGGGQSNLALDFYCTTGGVIETCMPYAADDTVPCGDACGPPTHFLYDWAYVPEDVDAIKSAIYTYGPICASFDVYDDFNSYTSGIYEHVLGDYLGGHAISIVGWDDTGQYWICKNSWGTDWGETTDGNPYTPGAGDGGWFRIRWGECDIEGRRTVAATMDAWPTATVDVTVLDGAGVGVEGAGIYVNGDYCGDTALDGTLALDLIGGMYHTVVAYTLGRFLLHDTVVSPSNPILDCRDASYITVSATACDGSPLDGELCFYFNRVYYPGYTSGGSGTFYITPGVYDYQFWGAHWGSSWEYYDLAFRDIDLTGTTTLAIDCTATPLTQWTLATLADSASGPYSCFELRGRPDGFNGAAPHSLSSGDSVFYNQGTWLVVYRLLESETPPSSWYYFGSYGSLTFSGGELFPIHAGGNLVHTTTSEAALYLPGSTAEVRADLYDAFGNALSSIYRYDAPSGALSGERPATLRETFRQDGSPLEDQAGYYFYPQLTVTPPTDPPIFNSQVQLGNWCDVELGPTAEPGTYSLRSTVQTHLGELEGLSSFGVLGPTAAVFRVESTGNVLADQTVHGASFQVGSADVAEWIQISEWVEPGDVLVFDLENPGRYQRSRMACSPHVAGVVSAQPGIALGSILGPVTETRAPLALTGIVMVKVTNEGGAILPGDLLVTSSTPGYAMRWPEPGQCPCSLVGKALEPMVDAQGVILVLLTAH